MRPSTKPRAIALITTLLMSSILLMMVVSLVKAVQQQTYQSRSLHDEVAALYVAEAGLADVMSRFELEPGWVEGFNNEEMLNRPGTYSVEFHPQDGSAVLEDQSVNNLEGAAATIGPRGRVVPAGSAVVVVSARVGRVERQLEAIINSAGTINAEFPIMTSGEIHMEGDLTITGIESLNSHERIAAGLHSNKSRSSDSVISWEKNNSSDEALVTGKVSTVNMDSDSIDFGTNSGDYDVGAFETDATRRRFPNMGDISFNVRSHSRRPNPPIVSGGTTSLPNAEFYERGDLSVQGDLELNGTELYIDGDLTVNGGISGEGAVWVTGVVEFKGDSRLVTDKKAAIMSEKGINLLGFDGNEYMEEFADRNPDAAALWSETKSVLGDIDDQIENNSPSSILGPDGPLDLLGRKLGDHPENLASDGSDVLIGGDYFGKLKGLLESEPKSDARDFMIRKMNDYADFFSSTDPENDADIAESFGDHPRAEPGAFDAVVDSADRDAIGALRTQVSSVSYGKLGDSYFQGLIYTEGHMFAANSVTALGAIMVDGKGDDSSPNPLDPSEDLKPGDLFMTKGANITFVEEFFSEGAGALSVKGPVRVRTWAAR